MPRLTEFELALLVTLMRIAVGIEAQNRLIGEDDKGDVGGPPNEALRKVEEQFKIKIHRDPADDEDNDEGPGESRRWVADEVGKDAHPPEELGELIFDNFLCRLGNSGNPEI